jgi:CBS domain-containing protein
LKLQASAIVVDAARLLALAAGLSVTPTRERLRHAGTSLRINESEVSSWITAFDFIQGLRLRNQLSAASPADANRLDVGSLDAVDRRVLKESLRVVRQLQQRIELDYQR